MRNVNVLIVDDSLLFREILQQELERDVNVHIVAKAGDPYEASKRIGELKPDVLIVDVFMDKMNGIEFVRQLLPQYSVPVIVISSDGTQRQAAESINNVTFFQKPAEGITGQSDVFFQAVLAKIRSLVNRESFDLEQLLLVEKRLIAIGASTGGAEAIERVLTKLPSMMPPIVISQHMPPKFTKTFAERLNVHCKLSVKEGENGDILIPGQVYIAPGGGHMTVVRRNGRLSVRCHENISNSPLAPSVDKLFDSVAEFARGEAIGVLLTGMGRDGAKGLKRMRETGNITIGQDEGSSIIYGMPKAAHDIGAVTVQMDLSKIPERIASLSIKRP